MARNSQRARRTSPLHLPSAFELYQPSKEIVLKNIWIFGPLFAVSLIFGIHGWIWAPTASQHVHWWHHAYGFGASLPGSPFPDFSAVAIGFSLFWLVFVLITSTLATIMTQTAQLDAVEHRRLDFQILWKTVTGLGFRLLGLYIVSTVLVVVGLFLLIVPGLILIRRFFLAPYVMIDKKVNIQEALIESTNLSRLNTGAIWGVFGVMILIALIGAVPFVGGIISFVLGCLYSVAPALRYHQLKRLSHASSH